MHFSVSCPACHTEFPVDSQKVPPDGIHAICSTCERVFFVERPEEAEPRRDDTEGAESGAEVVATEDPAVAEPESEKGEEEKIEDFEQFFEPVLGQEEGGGEREGEGGVALEEEEEPGEEQVEVEADAGDEWSAFGEELTLTEEEKAEDETQVAEEAVEEEAAAPEPPRFGQRDPEEKAARLARVLVQDMIAYNKELYEKALEQGTLEEDFEDEVEKSWEEYVERIGEELATSTTYFRDALNEILAKGEEVFDGPP